MELRFYRVVARRNLFLAVEFRASVTGQQNLFSKRRRWQISPKQFVPSKKRKSYDDVDISGLLNARIGREARREGKIDMTLLNDPRPISADSHAIESSEVFEGLAERFGDDAPRIVHSEGNGDWITIPNQPKRARNVAIMCLAGTRLDYEATA